MEELAQVQDEQPELIAPEPEQANDPQTAQQEAPHEHPKEDAQERNWRAARSRMEEQARLIKMQETQLQQMQQMLQELRSTSKEASEPEEEYFTDTEKKLYKEIKTLKASLDEQKSKEADIVVDRLRARFPDFDAVVNPENISYLQTNNAPLAKAIAAMKGDPYEQGLAAYELLKKTDWYLERQTMQDKAKLEENSKKPMSVQAVRKQGPLAEANRFAGGLTPELKKQLQQEMAAARKGA